VVTNDELLAELRVIRQLLADHDPVSRLSRADRDRLGALLPVVGAVVASEGFLVCELLRLESAGLRLVLAGCSGKALGRLLRRAEGVPVGGYVVERLGQEGGAVLWRVVKVVS